MSYVPRLPDASVNVPTRHPLADMALLLAGAAAIIVGIWWALGLAVDYAVDHLPDGFEQRLSAKVDVPADQESPRGVIAQDLLQQLLRHVPELQQRYSFVLTVSPEIGMNAMVLPGGRIVVGQALLDAAESKNELAMVLGHEIGHCAHRDHLRAIGRGLVIGVAAMALLGQNSSVSDALIGGVGLAQARYSRGQESAADLYGLELLQATFGHVGGATAFFKKVQSKDLRWAAWIGSHPLSADRIAQIEAMADARGFERRAVEPIEP